MTDAFEPCLDILNCGAGHLSIKVEGSSEEREKAKKIVEDMLRRGYTLVIETEDGQVRRVEEFDPKAEEYIVQEPPAEGEPKKRGRKKGVLMEKAKATGIGRTAGG